MKYSTKELASIYLKQAIKCEEEAKFYMNTIHHEKLMEWCNFYLCKACNLENGEMSLDLQSIQGK